MTDLSPETRALLAKAEMTPMPAERRVHVKRAVIAQIAAGTVIMTTSSATAKTGVFGTIATKVLVVASLAGLGAGAVVAWNQAHEAPTSVGATPTSVAATPTSVAATPTSVGASPATARSLPPVPSPTAGALSTTEPARPIVPGVNGPTASPAAPTRANANEVFGSNGPLPLAESRKTAVVRAADERDEHVISPPEPSARAAPQSSLMLQEETRLLLSALRASEAGEPERALAVLDEHAARFPRGVLEPERSAERVRALCRAGRIGEARAAGQRFLATERPAHLAARVRSSCAGSDK